MKTKNAKILISAVILLLIAGFIASCSKDKDAAPVIVKTDLETSVTAANTLVTSTHEGVATGNYLKGAQQPYVDAIAAAQLVIDDDNATQAQVTAAIANLAAATTAYQAQLVTPIDPDNLIGQWTFDEVGATTVVKDYGVGARNGTLMAGHVHWAGTGLPTVVADRYGIAGKALHFDKGQNVEIPYNTALNPQMISISLWMKQDVTAPIYADQYMVAMNRWNGYKFQMQGLPEPFFTAHVAKSPGDSTIYDHDAQLDNGLPQNVWYHLVVTFGNGHELFYINGEMVFDWGAGVSDPTPGTIVSLAAKPVNLVFGQDLPTAKYSDDSNSPYFINYGGYFHGTMDEIRIYKSVLTQAQVTSIYNVEKP